MSASRVLGLLLVVLALGACATAAPPSRATDHLDILNHVSCYPFGLDQIGRGDVAGGTETWRQCFGERTVQSGIDKRVAFARRIYESQGVGGRIVYAADHFQALEERRRAMP